MGQQEVANKGRGKREECLTKERSPCQDQHEAKEYAPFKDEAKNQGGKKKATRIWQEARIEEWTVDKYIMFSVHSALHISKPIPWQ
jgi:hypothetical protein